MFWQLITSVSAYGKDLHVPVSQKCKLHGENYESWNALLRWHVSAQTTVGQAPLAHAYFHTNYSILQPKDQLECLRPQPVIHIIHAFGKNYNFFKLFVETIGQWYSLQSEACRITETQQSILRILLLKTLLPAEKGKMHASESNRKSDAVVKWGTFVTLNVSMTHIDGQPLNKISVHVKKQYLVPSQRMS